MEAVSPPEARDHGDGQTGEGIERISGRVVSNNGDSDPGRDNPDDQVD